MKHLDATSAVEGASARTVRTHRNIYYSFVIKGVNIACQFLLVPLTLNYLDKTQYGVWLTLASLLNWLGFFDIGIGHGLRNKLAEAIASNDLTKARYFVSTAYACVAIIFGSLLGLFFLFSPFFDWVAILNVPESLRIELSKLILFVVGFSCIQFFLSLISSILLAYQKAALSNLILPIGNVLSLLIVFILTKTTPPSLFFTGIVFSCIPVLVLFVFNLILFNSRFKTILPSWKFIQWTYARRLITLGSGFLIIQVSVLMQFFSANIILSQLYGPESVTVYNIAFKYFTIGLMLAGIIMAPFWSAFTEAFVRMEYHWIQQSLFKLLRISIGIILVTLLLFFISEPLVALWIRQPIDIPSSLKFALIGFVVVSLLAMPFTMFINGTGKIRIQLCASLISIIITIPLALFYCKVLQMGPSGIIMSMITSTLPTGILLKLQSDKIINQKATGIWNK